MTDTVPPLPLADAVAPVEAAERTPEPRGLLPQHPKLAWVLRLTYMFWFAVPGLMLFVPGLALAGVPRWAALVLGPLIGIGIGALYGGAYCRRLAALELADGVLLRRGVFWRSELFVPKARIQHTDINQGPLDRRWGMASLQLHTAGVRFESLRIVGLDRALAEALRDQLLDRRKHADGA